MKRSELVLWACVFAALQVGDVVTTWAGLSRPGIVEQNPAAAWLFGTYGLWTLLPLKALALCLVLGLGYRLWLRFGVKARVLWAVAFLYVGVVVNNAAVIL